MCLLLVSMISLFILGCIIIGGNEGIHLCYGEDARLNGDAFVELASQDDVKLGLTKHRNHIGRRYVEGQCYLYIRRRCLVPEIQFSF